MVEFARPHSRHEFTVLNTPLPRVAHGPTVSNAVVSTRRPVVGFLLGVFLVAATLETLTWEAGPASLRPVHLILPILAFALSRGIDQASATLMRSVAAVSLAIVLLSLVPLVAHEDSSRLVFPLLLVVNLCCAAIAFAAIRSAGESGLRGISWALAIVMIVPVGQVIASAFGVVPPFSDVRFLVSGRPPGTFEEATWVGSMAAFAVAWAGYRRNPWLMALALPALITAASRGAIVAVAVAGVILLMRRAGSVGRTLAFAVYAGVAIACIAFTPVSFALPAPFEDGTSLETRVLDQYAIVDMVGDDWLIGGASLLVEDAARARILPSSSNNVIMDFFWKQGIFGIGIVVVLGWAALRHWPRTVDVSGGVWLQPGPFLIVILVLWLCVFNNGLPRTWLWIEYGVALGAAVTWTRSRAQRATEHGIGLR